MFSQSIRTGRLFVGVQSDSANGQAARYHLLGIAHAIFPEHFPRTRALRFSEEDRVRYGLIYSDFVEDSTGCIARKEAYLRESRDIQDGTGAHEKVEYVDVPLRQLKKRFNEEERRRCPQINEAEKKFKDAGILVMHPEANYHSPNGNPVFFEPYALDFELAMAFAGKLGKARKEKAVVHIGLLCLVALSESISRLKEDGKLMEEWLPLARLAEGKNGAFLRSFLKLAKEPEFSAMIGRSYESYVKFVAERLAF